MFSFPHGIPKKIIIYIVLVQNNIITTLVILICFQSGLPGKGHHSGRVCFPSDVRSSTELFPRLGRREEI